MRTHLWRIVSLVTLLALLISPIGATGSALAAPTESQSPAPQSNLRVIDASYVGVSKPLSSLAPVIADTNTPTALRQMQERLGMPKIENALGNGGFDPSIVQKAPVANSMPATLANFEGINNVSGVFPPDTQGDMGWDPATGTKYYIEWVNVAFQIWDVTNPAAVTSLYGPSAGNTLWTGTGTICEANNDGDPITQFDHLSNRWMMSQFALPNYPAGPFYQCVAISKTADPMGDWYLYTFKTSDTLMNDYPHFGVWPDGYYMTVNQFGEEATCTASGWCGAGVAVFERSQMLQGLPARLIYIDTGPLTGNSYGGMLPSDLDGPAPADGTPNYFMEWDDSTWLGDTADTLRVWEFKTDWAIPANTTFGANANYDPNLFIPTANVDPDMCGGARNCVDQPGTTAGLDAIADRLMYRLQFRDFGTYQTLVGNHTVDADSADHAGIHWFELRDTGTGFDMYQESVYAGDTVNTDSRWMGSIAMDEDGNMALGYSVSGAATNPSIRYTGRLSTEALNGLTQGEASIIAGTGSQTDASYFRWGDYSMMAVDASDGCTFWYTQEYYATTSATGWQTRVGSFKFPSCTTDPTGTLSGTVTDGVNPIAGAVISATGGYTTTTDALGNYTMLLVDGTYDVTASKYGYVSSTVNGVVVTASNTTDQDFTLTAASSSTVSGTVKDATTGWPLYASIEIYGYPLGTVFTDPVTGAYSVDLIDGSYTFTVSALSGGYTDTVAPIVVAGNATEDFTLAADLVACTAPGYVSGTTALTEGFEGAAFPPTGWNRYEMDAVGAGWQRGTTGSTGSHGSPHSGTYFAWHNDDAYDADSWLVTPQITVPAEGGSLTFWQNSYWSDYYWYHGVWITTDASPDPSTSTYTELWFGVTGETWTQQGIDLTAYAGQNVYIAFDFAGNFADEWYVDDVSVQSLCSPLASAGLVVGVVKDINTNLFLSNAVVEDAAFNQALFIDNSADTSEYSPLYIIAEPAGAVTLTASAPLYTNGVMSPTVVAGDVVRQDFGLDAGMLSVAPTSMTFNASGTQTATLTNDGGLGANYEIFAIPGTFAGYVPTGPFAPNTRHFGPKNLNDMDASQVRVDTFTTRNVPIIAAAGDVITSWNTGLTYGWGLGYNTDLDDLWISNILSGGGDNLDHNFTTAGVATGDTIDTSPWVGSYPADMTYNPFTNTLWQVNVGGDNCVYELDPDSMVETGNKICPLFGTSERGLAFNPLTNTYYAGSWNDNIINHFAPDGTLLDAVDVGLPIAGLAFNPGTGHLFVSISYATVTTAGVNDIYVLDVNDGYSMVGGFNIMNGATRAITDGDEKGLEIDCDGNLWLQAHDTTAPSDKVLSFASGETGVCDWQNSWLSTTPVTGSVAALDSSDVDVIVDATGMAAGTYNAYLRVVNSTPYGDDILPVTLNVANSAPVITSDGGGAAANKNVAENTTAVTTVTATDVNLDTLTYSISGADAALFSINPTTGVLTFLVAPDFENPTDAGANNTYGVIVQVSDGSLTDTQNITVIVTDVNELLYLFLPLIMR